MRQHWTGAVVAMLAASDAAALAPMMPVTAFLATCMSGQGKPDAIRAAAERRGFAVARPEHRAMLLRGVAHGDAYAARDIALVVERGQPRCTVYARSDNAGETKTALENNLPDPSSRFTVEREEAPGKPDFASTTYRIKLEGKPYATWVFGSFQGAGPFNVVITLQMNR